jgi:hypothetical protein
MAFNTLGQTKKPWWKHVLTVLAMLTAPIWLLPFMLVVLVVLLYFIADDALWGLPRRGSGNDPGP